MLPGVVVASPVGSDPVYPGDAVIGEVELQLLFEIESG